MTKLKELIGVVLAGGLSKRMKKDKSKLVYKTERHDLYTAKLLSKYCKTTIISRSSSDDLLGSFRQIKDVVAGKGPLGALYSVFQEYPDNALLVLACDLPFIDENVVESLIEARSEDYEACCIKSTDGKQIEPLIAIYENVIKSKLEKHFLENQLSPTKLLLESRLKTIHGDNGNSIFNANTPEEYRKAKSTLSKSD